MCPTSASSRSISPRARCSASWASATCASKPRAARPTRPSFCNACASPKSRPCAANCSVVRRFCSTADRSMPGEAPPWTASSIRRSGRASSTASTRLRPVRFALTERPSTSRLQRAFPPLRLHPAASPSPAARSPEPRPTFSEASPPRPTGFAASMAGKPWRRVLSRMKPAFPMSSCCLRG